LFEVIDVGTTEKLVSSACYDMQQVCVCNRSLARLVDAVAEITRFQKGTQIWCARTEDCLNLRSRSLHC